MPRAAKPDGASILVDGGSGAVGLLRCLAEEPKDGGKRAEGECRGGSGSTPVGDGEGGTTERRVSESLRLCA